MAGIENFLKGGLAGAMDAMKASDVVAKGLEKAKEQFAKQIAAQDDFQQQEAGMVNPTAAKLDKFSKALDKDTIKSRMKENKESVLKRAEFEGAANDFNRDQPGKQKFKPEDLIDIRMKILPGMNKDGVKRILSNLINDTQNPEAPATVDKILEFLEKVDDLTTNNPNAVKLSPEQKEAITAFRNDYYKKNEGAIQAARGAEGTAKAGAAAPLPEAEAAENKIDQLFDKTFKEGFDKVAPPSAKSEDVLKNTTQFQKDVGKELTVDIKKPIDGNPEAGQLADKIAVGQLMIQIRTLVKFFSGPRWELIKKKIGEAELKIPEQLTPMTITREFVKLVSDPYPSVSKVMESAVRLGIDRSVPMMIIVFELGFRDAVDNMPPKILPFNKRNDLKATIIATLEELYERESSDIAA